MSTKVEFPEGAESATEATGGRRSLDSVVRSIATAISATLSPGDVAALRRLDPDELSAPAFWKVVTAHVEPAGFLTETGAMRADAERRWAVVLTALALLGSTHRANSRLGRALAVAGFSELRLVRLLRSRERQLGHEVRTAVRFLAAKGEPVDATDLARLVLSDGMEHADEVRRDVARAYYGAQHAVEGRS
jgi:CRISPR system Cascade subunit CasB